MGLTWVCAYAFRRNYSSNFDCGGRFASIIFIQPRKINSYEDLYPLRLYELYKLYRGVVMFRRNCPPERISAYPYLTSNSSYAKVSYINKTEGLYTQTGKKATLFKEAFRTCARPLISKSTRLLSGRYAVFDKLFTMAS
jgi:hypothetical protein